MPKNTTVETVKDGRIKRDSASGRFLSVESISSSRTKVSKSVAASALSMQDTAIKRRAALERLKNR